MVELPLPNIIEQSETRHFCENDVVLMSFADAIKTAIAITSQVLNADNPKLAKLILPMANFSVTE